MLAGLHQVSGIAATDPGRTAARTLVFPVADALLREDAKRLGAMVGAILAEQCGDAFLPK